MELGLPYQDPRCYQYKPTPHKKIVSEEEAERIVEYVMSTPKTRRQSAVQLIKEMDLKGVKTDRYGREMLMSESCFKQVMYDNGIGRGVAGWKTDLSDEHRQNRLLFAQKYRHFDWKRRGISSDEAKIKEAEHYNKKVWRTPGEELSVNVINRSEQSHNKAMGQISARIGHEYKSKLVFLWPETEEEKQEAAAELKAENENRVNWNALLFAVNQEVREQEEIAAGRKKSGPKPQYKVFKKNQLLTRGDRSNGGMDWYIYFNRVLKVDAFPELKQLQQQGRDPVMIEDNAGNHTACDEFWGIYKLRKFNDWPAKSPDLNPIEKAWAWCRQWLRDNDMVFNNRREAMRGWRSAWKALPQPLINQWFEEMEDLLNKVIEHDGNNDFQA